MRHNDFDWKVILHFNVLNGNYFGFMNNIIDFSELISESSS